MEQKVDYFDEIKEISGIIHGLSVREALDYVHYREKGDKTAAMEIILDKAAELNAIFAGVYEKISKKG